MIEKGSIIEEALLMIGETTDYNNNSSYIHKLADRMLSSIISNLSYDNTFLFNAVEFTLNKSITGTNFFNIPSDFLNLVSSTQVVQMTGEFFVCDSDEVTILYCKKMNSSDLPSYITEYLKASLCYKLALTNSTYNEKIGYFENLRNIEASNLINSQYYDIEKWVVTD